MVYVCVRYLPRILSWIPPVMPSIARDATCRESHSSRSIHTACQRPPTLSVYTIILFPMFDTGNVMLIAMLMLAKIETWSILSQGMLP